MRRLSHTSMRTNDAHFVRDIDVASISIDAGMQVRFRKLDGGAVTLLGIGDRAIATISPSGNRGRDRFSIGQELGHWSMHRGQAFYCRAENFGQYTRADRLKEKQADEFSSRLMPTSLLRPAIGKFRALSLSEFRGLALGAARARNRWRVPFEDTTTPFDRYRMSRRNPWCSANSPGRQLRSCVDSHRWDGRTGWLRLA